MFKKSIVKKHLKNVMLFFSIGLMFFLVWQIWFGSYFLPGGYDYITTSFRTHIMNPIQQWFTKESKEGFSQNMKVLFKPEKIILNHSGQRVVFQSGHKDYEEMRSLSNEFISNVLLEKYTIKSKVSISVETYHSLLKGKTIYVDYGKECDFRLFSLAVCDQSSSVLTEDLSVINGYIIGLHDSVMNDVSLYITDKKSNNIYRYVIETEKSTLDEQLKEFLEESAGGSIPSYSFELNFHKEQENSASKVLFEPLVLLDLTTVEVPTIQLAGTEEENREKFDELTDAVLEVFSVNSRTMRRYTDLENARVFVENNATLTLYPNGILEYQAVQGSHGLDISNSTDRTNYDVHKATADAVDFVTELCNHMPNSYFKHLQISTSLVNHTDKHNSFKLSFDYCIDGIPVRQQTENGYCPVIEMEVREGYLTSYRHNLKVYEKRENEIWQLPPVISAADKLVNALYDGTNALRIEKVAVCYTVDKEGNIAPTWNGIVDGKERLFE
ncbi:MAG: hypothetical protein E7403_00870 [Ruminococcaceae bacterium]|nr:hypothetical protein [Oscillospiraceae bacterium]